MPVTALLLLLPAVFAAQPARDLSIQRDQRSTTFQSGGTRWAVIIGISSYKYLPSKVQLRFAHRDAEDFADFLRSDAGGSIPDTHIRLLTNEQATLAEIRAALHTWLPRSAGPQDIVYFFFAGHGVLDDHNDGYFVANDSDPQNLHATALSFRETDSTLSYTVRSKLVVLIADACHAGRLGWTTYSSAFPNEAANQLEKFGQSDRSFLKLLAASPSETSFESERWNGGHGVFTNSLLQGLRGDADQSGDRLIRASRAIDYVSHWVPEETQNRQHPRIAGTFDASVALAVAPVRIETGRPADAVSVRRPSSVLFQLRILLQTNRLLDPNGAWDFYRSHSFGPTEQADADAMISGALEDAGQACVGDYVQSTAMGLKRAMLERAVEAYQRLQLLRPGDAGLEVRQLFCKGRLQIAENRLPEAIVTMENVLKRDPEFACAYNAMGVAYLRVGRKKQARAAFEKAAQLTPEWALPPYQIASQLIVAGELGNARPYLAKAVQLNPGSVTTRWSLMHVDRLLGHIKEVPAEAGEIIRLNPNYAPTYIDLGLAYEAAGKFAKAADAYDTYLLLAPNFNDSNAVRARANQIRSRR